MGARRRAGTVTVGTVVRFDRQQGYGFVEPDDGGADVFLHASLLEEDAKERMRAGMRVEFKVAGSDRGPKAVSARLLDGRRPPQPAAPAAPVALAPPVAPVVPAAPAAPVAPPSAAAARPVTAPAGVAPEPVPPVPGAGPDDDLCDVLSAAEFGQKITDTLIDAAPEMTGAQIVQARQQLIDFAQRHGWVDR
jgi:cold shock protein